MHDGATEKLVFMKLWIMLSLCARWNFGIVKEVCEIVFFTLHVLICCRYIFNMIRSALKRMLRAFLFNKLTIEIFMLGKRLGERREKRGRRANEMLFSDFSFISYFCTPRVNLLIAQQFRNAFLFRARILLNHKIVKFYYQVTKVNVTAFAISNAFLISELAKGFQTQRW